MGGGRCKPGHQSGKIRRLTTATDHTEVGGGTRAHAPSSEGPHGGVGARHSWAGSGEGPTITPHCDGVTPYLQDQSTRIWGSRVTKSMGTSDLCTTVTTTTDGGEAYECLGPS